MSRQTTRLMVLGIVAHRQPVSGYDIAKVLEEWAVSRWTTIAPASIYQQLRTLTANNFIAQDGMTATRATRYTCTTAGSTELRRLLLELLDESDVQPLSLIPLLHFTPMLTTEQLDTGLAARIAAIDRALGLENDMIERSAAVAPAHVTEIFRLTWHGLRADKTWCQEFRQRLNRPGG